MNAKLNHQSELTSLMRLIGRAVKYNCFALILANCSSLSEQKLYMEELERRCSHINITLTTVNLWNRTPIDNLYSIIREHLSQSFPDKLPSNLAIQVTGLEVSILLDADERFPNVLQTLNISRERFRDRLPYPLLIWLPDYAHIKLANVAPDFWSVRYGSFTFPADEQPELVGDLDQMGLEKKDITEWQDKTAQIPLIERILDSPIRLSDETRIDLVLKLAEAYRFVGKTDKAKESFEKALRLNQEQLGDLEREGTTLNGLGLVYTDWGKFPEAIKHFEQYLTLKSSKDEAQAVGYNHLGFAQYKHGEHLQAIQSFEKALAINQSLGKRKAQGDVLGNLGLVYRELGEFEPAIEYHQQALEISREISQQQSEVKDLGNIGLVYYTRQDYERAIEYYTQALKLSQQVGNRQDELDQLLNLGDAWRDRSEFEQARKHYEMAHRIAEEIGQTRLNLLILERLVDLYASEALKDTEREVYWTEKFIQQSEASENLDNQQYCIEKLLKICQRQGLSLYQKNEWLLKAGTLVKQTFAPNSCVYLEKLVEICQGLNQNDRVELLQQELAQMRRERQLTFWLPLDSVKVIDDQPILQVDQSYTVKIQIGELTKRKASAWIYCRNLPEERSYIKFENKPREGFKMSRESTETIEEEPPKQPDITSTSILALSPPPLNDSEQTGRPTTDPASQTAIKGQKGDNTALSEEKNKIETAPSLSLKFHGVNLDISPKQTTLPLQTFPSSAPVSFTVCPKTCGDHRILITVSLPAQKIRDKFEIPLRVVEHSAVKPPIEKNPDSIISYPPEPDYEDNLVTSHGLALVGSSKEQFAQFRQEAESLLGDDLQEFVKTKTPILAERLSEIIALIILNDIALPELRKWKSGLHKTLNTAIEAIKDKCTESNLTKQLISNSSYQQKLKDWVEKDLIEEINGKLLKLCQNYGLTDFKAKDVDITRVFNVISVSETFLSSNISYYPTDTFAGILQFIIAPLISILVASIVFSIVIPLILSISGVISTTLVGIIIGILVAIPAVGWSILSILGGISAAALALKGWQSMRDDISKAMMSYDLPKWIRNRISNDKIKSVLNESNYSLKSQIERKLKSSTFSSEIAKHLADLLSPRIEKKIKEILYIFEESIRK